MNIARTRRRIIVGVTGASGGAYARRLIDCLDRAEAQTHLIVSDHGKRLLHDELGLTNISARTLLHRDSKRLTLHPFRDIGASPASGSFSTEGMVICPCSSHTLGAIASGLGDNLLHRAAAVTLKEQRRLIVVTREMPMSRIDLQNALKLSDAGAIICPACPGFYMEPKTIEDLVDFVVGKVLDLLAVPHELDTRWAARLDRERTATPEGHRF